MLKFQPREVNKMLKKQKTSLSGFKRSAHLHGRVAVIGCGACGQLYSCDSKTPYVCFKIVASNLRQQKVRSFVWQKHWAWSCWLLCSGEDGRTCSITSGAIQHGVPTKVFRTLFLVISPPVARNELTPKSENTLTITLITHWGFN